MKATTPENFSTAEQNFRFFVVGKNHCENYFGLNLFQSIYSQLLARSQNLQT